MMKITMTMDDGDDNDLWWRWWFMIVVVMMLTDDEYDNGQMIDDNSCDVGSRYGDCNDDNGNDGSFEMTLFINFNWLKI